jgi:hypothetical protein
LPQSYLHPQNRRHEATEIAGWISRTRHTSNAATITTDRTTATTATRSTTATSDAHSTHTVVVFSGDNAVSKRRADDIYTAATTTVVVASTAAGTPADVIWAHTAATTTVVVASTVASTDATATTSAVVAASSTDTTHHPITLHSTRAGWCMVCVAAAAAGAGAPCGEVVARATCLAGGPEPQCAIARLQMVHGGRQVHTRARHTGLQVESDAEIGPPRRPKSSGQKGRHTPMRNSRNMQLKCRCCGLSWHILPRHLFEERPRVVLSRAASRWMGRARAPSLREEYQLSMPVAISSRSARLKIHAAVLT